MSKHQLEIPGIGQQLATLADWKKDNSVFTHHADHMPADENPWCAWDEIESPSHFLEKFGDLFGYGKTEKAAIIDFCGQHDIKLPFWW